MGHVSHEGTLHHARLHGTLRFLLQLFLFLHEWCYVTDHAIALHKLSVFVEMWQTVEHVPLQFLAVVEDGPCIAEVGYGPGEVDFRLAETLHNDAVVDEIRSQFLETQYPIGCGELLVEGNFVLDKVCAPEPHVALLHQILQFVLILLYLLVLLTDEGLVLFVVDKEVAFHR